MENTLGSNQMNSAPFSPLKDKRLTAIFVLCVLLVLFTIYLIIAALTQKQTLSTVVNEPIPTPTKIFFPSSNKLPFSNAATPLQKVEPGKKYDEKSLESMPGYFVKEAIPNNQTEYRYTSEIITRPNTIITDTFGNVIFEREETPTDPNTSGYTKLSDIKNKYGQPEKSVTGSKFFGYYLETDIYASKGLAVIANPHTDEVFEVQTFLPTTVDNYISTFGSDLNPNISPIREGPGQ